jgi:hypothetical protein
VADAPNPQPLDAVLTIDGVTEYKRHDCRRYVKCMDFAANQGWSQFHCNNCTAYIPLADDDPSHRVLAAAGRKLIKNGVNK